MSELIHAIGYWVADLGPWGYPLALLLMTGVAVLPIPAEIPAAVNGMLFGPLIGTVITWSGALAGAQISFELSRRLGRPLAERIITKTAIDRVDNAVDAVSWPGLLIARFIPLIAFTALNWCAGLTACPRKRFLWTTALGIIPGTVLFVLTGEGMARLYGEHPTMTAVLALVGLGLIVVVATRHRLQQPSN